jgi:pimeloyl-ACP methyl ester carboxylesterase
VPSGAYCKGVTPPPSAPGRLIDVGGVRLHLNLSGNGPETVVLEAALGASSAAWSLVQPPLARDTRVCSYDRAGFGWSDPGELPRTAGRMADELRRLLERAGVPPPFILVGHSFGAFVSLIFARTFRAETSGLVLVDPAHASDWLEPSRADRLKVTRGLRLSRVASVVLRPRVVRAAVAPLAFGLARAVTTIMRRGRVWARGDGTLAPLDALPDDARRAVRHFWTQPTFYRALYSQIASMRVSAREAQEACAGGFDSLPLITISSSYATDARRHQQESLARLSSRGRHLVASRSGHWIPLEEPETVVNAVRDVLTLQRTSPA